MPVALNRDIRRILEDAVRKARIAAEKGALNALGELGVADARRPAWLSPAQAELRNRLRAHARALGDRLNPDDTMRVERLVREIAYAHWHRALFARFLLENGLLVDVEAGDAPVGAADVRAIAEEENRDVAEVAAEFAQPMLPEIFRRDDPVLALALPPEARQELARLVDGLPAQTFRADDALGWTYQFWQADRKRKVNESEVKIGADELPAVTQLFTEDYMVLFLLENTLGAWWAGRRLAENPDLALAADEDELRRKLSPPGYRWTYLRFVPDHASPAPSPQGRGERALLPSPSWRGVGGEGPDERGEGPDDHAPPPDPAAPSPTPLTPVPSPQGRGERALLPSPSWRGVGGEGPDESAEGPDDHAPPSDPAAPSPTPLTPAPSPQGRGERAVLPSPSWRGVGGEGPDARGERPDESAEGPDDQADGPAESAGRARWRPAAGVFPGWPKTAREITMLDPCMGSGHFLVFALDILVAMRRAEEGLDEEEAVVAVLRDNLHGLEIDPRCTQIAAFALALNAWKRIGRVRPLPALNLACSGLAIGMGKAEFVKLAERIAEAEGFAGGSADLLGRERNPMEEAALARRRGGLERLHDLFAQAPILGSLIDPRRALGDYGTLFSEGFEGLSGVIGKVLDKADGDPETREAAVTAQGLAKAAELLGRTFTLVATNVPYLGKGSMTDVLLGHVGRFSPSASADLSTVFIMRLIDLCADKGSISVVSPQNWLFLKSYRKFRKTLITQHSLLFVSRLGSGAFETISGEVVNVTLSIIEKSKNDESDIRHLDVHSKIYDEKSKGIIDVEVESVSLESQLKNPDSVLTFKDSGGLARLREHVQTFEGMSTGDGARYLFSFWELAKQSSIWEAYHQAPDGKTHHSSNAFFVRWEQGRGPLAVAPGARIQGHGAWGKRAILVGVVSRISCALTVGGTHDKSTVALRPNFEQNLPAIYTFCSSACYEKEIRNINRKLAVSTATTAQVPFDLAHWRRVAAERYPNGLPKPYSNDPTQWLFDGHPRGSADPNALDADGNPTRPGMAEHPLQVAVARLLGYAWPRQTGSSFMDCAGVDAPDEIDASGRVDADGIVCLPALAGEAGAAERLRGVLRAAWGADWGEGVVRACLQAEGAKAEDLDAWLAGEFFEGHCKLFHQTPFVWHVWDGLPDGFSALVNYHRLCAPDGGGRRLLEKLRDTYLGEWTARQRRLAADGDALAEDRLAAAEHLRRELDRIIEGEPPYDIFVRWKPLSRQPIGWEPDIDDGVRLNIRPFLTARPRNARGAKACILRVRPGVKKHEGADRGGEPHRERAEFPWFWAEDHDVATVDFEGGPEFRGRRYNDFHYSRGFKEAARGKLGGVPLSPVERG